MFGFFKKKAVPEWASFMDKRQYAEFIKALEAFLQSHGASEYKIDDGVLLFYDEGPFGLERAGLQNLAQVCAQNQPENYPEITFAHFESLRKSNEFFQNFDNELQDFEKVKSYLGVRLQGGEYIRTLPDSIVFREIAEDLYRQLVFDLPDAVRSVHPDEAAAWPLSEDELFELAQANIRQNYPLEKQWYDHEETGFWMVAADHYFSPNIIFDMEKYEDLLGPQGALIGLPHRHGVLIHPIKTLMVLKAVSAMIRACRNMHAAGPGSITPNLFWYKDGRFTNLPYVVGKDNIEFQSPDVFTDMLKTLPEP